MQLSKESIGELSEKIYQMGFRHYQNKEDCIELIERIITKHLKEDAVRSSGK